MMSQNNILGNPENVISVRGQRSGYSLRPIRYTTAVFIMAKRRCPLSTSNSNPWYVRYSSYEVYFVICTVFII